MTPHEPVQGEGAPEASGSPRTSRVRRATKETTVEVELGLDGTGAAKVSTGVPFFDHMLAQLARHGLLDLTVLAHGDTEIDAHHTVEDTALTLGLALREALGDKAGITRFGDAVVPLDETLARAVRFIVLRPLPGCRGPRAGPRGTPSSRLAGRCSPAASRPGRPRARAHRGQAGPAIRRGSR